jgi:hypothetical protein
MFSSGKILFSQRPCDWNKLGEDKDGILDYDSRGSIVMLSDDGKTLATLSGSAAARDISEHQGRVRIFTWNGSSWTQKGADILNSLGSGNTIGSMCLSGNGNYFSVSEYNVVPTETVGLGWGRVKTYGWNGSSWAAVGQPIVYENEINLHNSKVSLNFAGNVLAIGSPEVDMPKTGGPAGMNILAGMVRVYAWNESSWSKRGQDITSNLANGMTGTSVSLSDDGNALATGSLWDIGFVSVYQLTGSSWTKKGIDIQGKANGDRLGATVCLSGDGNTVSMGSQPGAFGEVEEYGYVSAYSWSGSSWVKKGSDIFGCHDSALSMSRSGNVLAMGNLFLGGNGRARAYTWNGSSWTKRGKDFKGTFQSRTGQSVAISGNGNVVAVGNPGVSSMLNYACGRIYAYEWSPEKPSVLFVRW